HVGPAIHRSHRAPTDGVFDLVANDDRGAIAPDDGSTPAGHRPTSRVRLTVRVLTCLQAPVRCDAWPLPRTRRRSRVRRMIRRGGRRGSAGGPPPPPRWAARPVLMYRCRG